MLRIVLVLAAVLVLALVLLRSRTEKTVEVPGIGEVPSVPLPKAPKATEEAFRRIEKANRDKMEKTMQENAP